VHTRALGGSVIAVTKPVAIERLERGFRVERWPMGSDAPPFHRKDPDKTARSG
jgi:vanillate O-demethylase monooxygenase subunit